MAKSDIFKFEMGEYTPYYAYIEPSRTQAEIAKEYSRLRSIAVKRIARLEQAGFITSEYAATQRKLLPTLKDVGKTKNPEKLRGQALVRAAQYLRQGGTVTKARERQKEISEMVGRDIAPQEVQPFEDYMRAWRLYASSYMDSDRAASDYNNYSAVGGSAEDFFTDYEKFVKLGGAFE